jgi:hypothetical protein
MLLGKKKKIKLDDDDLDSKDNDDFLDDLDNDDFDFGGSDSLPPIEKHSQLLKELTDFSPYLKETLNNWLGISWNEEEKRYKKNPYLKPMLSVQGAVWCISFLKTYVRNNNILTHISQEEYQNLLVDAVDTIFLNLGTRKELGIQSNGDLIRVCNEMLASISLILMGAGDGKYSKVFNTVYQHNVNENMRDKTNNDNKNYPNNNSIMDRIRRVIR